MAVTPHYHEALLRAIHNIQAGIRHKDLAIQIDIAMEFALLHDVWYPEWQTDHLRYLDAANTGHGELLAKLVEQIGQLADAVEEDVELGFHLCYGRCKLFTTRQCTLQ